MVARLPRSARCVAVVRIGRRGDQIELRWVLSTVQTRGADDAPPVVSLTLTDWDRLQDALISANFWAPIDGDEQLTVAAFIASRGLDGSDWLIEGRRKESSGPSTDGARAAPFAILGSCSSSWRGRRWRK
jgi:hypothetical protein